jgi:hypothetical protein
VKRVARRVDMLLSFNNFGIFPIGADRKGLLSLWSSQLVTGWMIAGQPQPSCTNESCTYTVTVNTVGAEHFQLSEFIWAEALGTDMPTRCAAC